MDASLLLAHSEKENATPAYKRTFGFHPLLVTCDNTNELPTVKLRAGNAGSNTAADHVEVLTDALAQMAAGHVLVRADGAGSTHAFLNWLTGKNSPRRSMQYSIGWRIDGDDHAAITALPDTGWTPALNADGEVRDGASYRVLHTAARLLRGQRRRRLCIPATWPWAEQITTAFHRITAIPASG